MQAQSPSIGTARFFNGRATFFVELLFALVGVLKPQPKAPHQLSYAELARNMEKAGVGHLVKDVIGPNF